jgi:GR25 family glycosyltransferase involved in LPS biosynthesis
MKSFIIRLKNNELSNITAIECVVQAKKFNLDINFFDALTPDDANKLISDDRLFQYPKKLKHESGGVKGCFASHYSLWKMCSKQSESFLILEHDAYMIRALPANIENVVLDVCKLDSCNPFNEDYDNNVIKNNGDNIIDYDLSWGYKGKNAPYGGYFMGAWSYILKPHAAKIMIDTVHKNGWVPADKQFGENILKLQCTSSTIFRIHSKYNSNNIKELSLTRK